MYGATGSIWDNVTPQYLCVRDVFLHVYVQIWIQWRQFASLEHTPESVYDLNTLGDLSEGFVINTRKHLTEINKDFVMFLASYWPGMFVFTGLFVKGGMCWDFRAADVTLSDFLAYNFPWGSEPPCPG